MHVPMEACLLPALVDVDLAAQLLEQIDASFVLRNPTMLATLLPLMWDERNRQGDIFIAQTIRRLIKETALRWLQMRKCLRRSPAHIASRERWVMQERDNGIESSPQMKVVFACFVLMAASKFGENPGKTAPAASANC